jgi:predicted CXXCH cytochrome family protein
VSRKLWLAAPAGVALAGAVYFVLSSRPNKSAPAAEAASGYIDSAACAGCHQEIARTYRETAMGRSFYRPHPANSVEDYQARNSFYHRASDRYYTMIERDRNWVQRRHQIGFGGKETNVVEKEVDYVIGSGNHARSYLSRAVDGKLVELPVSWYAERAGYWAMSPGYDRPDQEDFRRAIPYECMFCHNGYRADPVSYSEGGEPVFGNRMPEGIDCQRCHGPGRAHVTAAGSGRSTSEAIRQAIVNPARLDRDRQLEVCMQCHLETTSRPLPNSIRRYDRSPFSYRPGERLGDFSLYFDHAPGSGLDDKFEIAHAADRLRKSACFRASQMTCTTCHNPHRAARGAEVVQGFVAVCRGCHSSAHKTAMPAAASCLDCHMPKRRTQDAVHVVITDHYIQRSKPARDLLAPRQEAAGDRYRGAVSLYYPPGENELYTAVAQVQDAGDLPAGIPRLRQDIERDKPDRPQFYFELGKAYSKAGNQDEAIHWYEEALRHQVDFRLARKGLGIALFTAGRLEQAAEALEKIAPPDAASLTNLGNVYLQQGNLERAQQALDQALGANPDTPDACNLLGLLWSQKGDRAKAEGYFREAIRIQPELAAAHNNLANLLAGAHDYAQAAYHFERAITSDPKYVQAHHSYGMLLLLMRSYDKALRELQETVSLDPNLAQAHCDLADVLAAQGRVAEARAHYQKAAEGSDPAAREEALKALGH